MKKSSIKVLIPLMIAFFTMGFVDLVGIATNYVKADFQLTDTLANLLPSMVFLWFLVLSVPTGLLMNRIGRKNTVLLSLVLALPALLLPMVSYTFPVLLISFCFLGIGNTLLQVSLNPLVANLVEPSKMASTLTFGQFMKAIAAFTAPILAAYAMVHFGDWRAILFPLFAAIAALLIIYLYFTKVQEKALDKPASFAECFALLKDPIVLIMFFGIVVHVGLDVGINTTAPRVLQEKLGQPLSEAGFATSFYFIFRTIGSLLGAWVLAAFATKKIFQLSVLMITVGTLCLLTSNLYVIYTGIALFGLGNSNVFSMVFSQALLRQPSQNNEISGLMIMGVSGGALFPMVMGISSDAIGSQLGAILVLFVGIAYLVIGIAPRMKA